MTIVSNTTPLIAMAAIGRFALLQELFGEILIAQAVYDEAAAGSQKDEAFQRLKQASWIRVETVEDREAVQGLLETLDLGEAERLCWPSR